MGELGKQPIGIGVGGGCQKAGGPSFDNLPANRWTIKKRILKELIFGDGKQASKGECKKLPRCRWQIKKRLLKELFSSTTIV